MVLAVRAGWSYRKAARRFHVGVATVALWVQRARGRPLSRVDWQDRSSRPQRRVGTPAAIVRAIRRARHRLAKHDALGEHGAAAIRRELLGAGLASPCVRTIARWLARLGLSGQERWRRPPPPKGWYLPEFAAGRAELDSCDVIEGLRLRRGGRLEVLNALGLWNEQPDSTVAQRITTAAAIAALTTRWTGQGRPAFVQFDNDTIFSGAHAQRNYFGRLVHWCLCLGITPVFAPPAELGFQATIEAYNRRWQDRVWRRWRHPSLAALQRRSAAFIRAYQHAKATQAQAHSALRRPWSAPTPTPCSHLIILLRRLDEHGRLTLCAQTLRISRRWAHRLVRCEINVTRQRVRCFGLSRRDPSHQPLLADRALHLRLVPWHKAPT